MDIEAGIAGIALAGSPDHTLQADSRLVGNRLVSSLPVGKAVAKSWGWERLPVEEGIPPPVARLHSAMNFQIQSLFSFRSSPKEVCQSTAISPCFYVFAHTRW